MKMEGGEPFSLSCQITLCQNRESDSRKHLMSGLGHTRRPPPRQLCVLGYIGKYARDNRVSVQMHSYAVYINRAGVLFMSRITLVQAEEAAHTPALRCDASTPNHTGQVRRCPRLPLPTLLPIIIIYSRIKGGFLSPSP